MIRVIIHYHFVPLVERCQFTCAGMYSIGTINEIMSYISTMISYALLCIRVAEVVYSRHQKWEGHLRYALAGRWALAAEENVVPRMV
jgi:hypothetical protein